MVDIQQGALRAFANDARAILQRRMQIDRRVADVVSQECRRFQVAFCRRPRVQGCAVLPPQRLVGRFDGADKPLGKDLDIQQHVARADAGASGFVQVCGTDAAQGCANFGVAKRFFARRVQGNMRRRDDMRPRTYDQILRRDGDAQGAHGLNLAHEIDRVDDHAIAHHGHDIVMQHARRQQMQLVDLPFYGDGVTGIVAAGIARHDIGIGSQPVDYPALALVAPLRADQNGNWHFDSLTRPDNRQWRRT